MAFAGCSESLSQVLNLPLAACTTIILCCHVNDAGANVESSLVGGMTSLCRSADMITKATKEGTAYFDWGGDFVNLAVLPTYKAEVAQMSAALAKAYGQPS